MIISFYHGSQITIKRMFIFLIVSLWQLTWYSWLQMFKFSSHNVPAGHSIINPLSPWHIKNFEQSVWCFTKTVPWTGSVHIASGSARGSMDELKINAEKRWQQLAWNELKKNNYKGGRKLIFLACEEKKVNFLNFPACF